MFCIGVYVRRGVLRSDSAVRVDCGDKAVEIAVPDLCGVVHVVTAHHEHHVAPLGHVGICLCVTHDGVDKELRVDILQPLVVLHRVVEVARALGPVEVQAIWGAVGGRGQGSGEELGGGAERGRGAPDELHRAVLDSLPSVEVIDPAKEECIEAGLSAE